MPKLREENVSMCEGGVGKENISMNESISPEDASERMLTVENFLRDFDIQVKERIKNMETMMKKNLAELTRLGNSEKLKISKDIRAMTVREFLAKGGDLDTLEFKEISSALNSTFDVSFAAQATQDSEEMETTTNENSPALGKRNVTRNKTKRAAEPSLLQNTLVKNMAPGRQTRSRVLKESGAGAAKKAMDTTTPLSRGGLKTRKKELPTPMITPKFDPTKPLKSAREPNPGETLVSLSGSPVVTSNRAALDADNSELVSISMSTDQAILGGRLFVDDALSPNTLHQQKQVIEEAMAAINSRLGALNSQIGSKLDMS